MKSWYIIRQPFFLEKIALPKLPFYEEAVKVQQNDGMQSAEVQTFPTFVGFNQGLEVAKAAENIRTIRGESSIST